jgi:hypothetical protein
MNRRGIRGGKIRSTENGIIRSCTHLFLYDIMRQYDAIPTDDL